MGEDEEQVAGEEIVMEPEVAVPSKPVDKNRELVKKMLDGCLKHGLTALCKEKPEEPIKWLAHWLLENNPNQPRVRTRFPMPLTPCASAACNYDHFVSVPSFAGVRRLLTKAELLYCLTAQVSKPGKALPEIAPAMHKPGNRHGLLQDGVLVPDPLERSENEHVKYPMPGAPGFVHCIADRTSLVSQCSKEGVEHVLEAMQHGAAGPPTSVVWISLRNELVTYIAGRPYALRDAAAPLQPKEISGENMQAMERDLKASVEEEVANGFGRLALQGPGGSKVAWTSVALGSIHNPAEIVEEAGRRAAGVTGIMQTRFESMPLPSRRPLVRQHITTLLELLQTLSSSDAVVVSSEKGAPVSTMVAVAASMAHRMRASNGLRPRDLISREPLPLTRKYNPPRGLLEEMAPVDALVKALDDVNKTNDGSDKVGELAKLLCDDTIDRWETPLHVRRRVAELERAARIAGEDAAAPGPRMKEANVALVQYLMLVAFAALLQVPAPGKEVAEHHTAVLDALDIVVNSVVTE